MNLLKRYLGKKPQADKQGREYPWLYNDIELLAFCLMPTHFHLLIYQKKTDAMSSLLQSVSTAYSMYFNKRHKRFGPLFQNRYKASMILDDNYLLHISRYIHLNPNHYLTWEFSSLSYHLNKKSAHWVRPLRITELFNSVLEYQDFLSDYEDYKQSLDEIKTELANY